MVGSPATSMLPLTATSSASGSGRRRAFVDARPPRPGRRLRAAGRSRSPAGRPPRSRRYAARTRSSRLSFDAASAGKACVGGHPSTTSGVPGATWSPGGTSTSTTSPLARRGRSRASIFIASSASSAAPVVDALAGGRRRPARPSPRTAPPRSRPSGRRLDRRGGGRRAGSGRGRTRRPPPRRARSAPNAAACRARKPRSLRRSSARNGWWSASANAPSVDVELQPAGGHVGAQVQQLLGRRPGTSGSGRRTAAATARLERAAPAVPDLDGAADELVAARPLHAVDAQVGAADADRVLRRPGAGRVVLGGDQAVARVQRGRDRRAEVDVAEAEHEVLGVEHRAVHVVDAARPLTRRMNSMFHGHHGASSRTPAMYRSIASRVAGSSQDSGRWTRAARHHEVVRRRAGRPRARAPASSACPSGSASGSTCTCSERMPGVRSTTPAGPRPRSRSASACTRIRRPRSSVIAPYSTSRLSSPLRR